MGISQLMFFIKKAGSAYIKANVEPTIRKMQVDKWSLVNGKHEKR